jgi:hypothetical protein
MLTLLLLLLWLVDGVERLQGMEAVVVVVAVAFVAMPLGLLVVLVLVLILVRPLRGVGMGAVDDACSSKFLIILVN